ncbi:MAG: hypothetical protein ACYSTZ_06885 [Planctomycetota bacterium]
MIGLYGFVDRFRQPSQWLIEQQWAQWALIAIAASTAFLLLLKISRRRRRQLAGAMHIDHFPGGAVTGDVAHSRRMDAAAGRGRTPQVSAVPTELVSHPEISIRQLRREIFKRDQAEARLEHQIDELKIANRQLRQKIAEHKEVCAYFEQKVAELTAAAELAGAADTKKNGKAEVEQPPRKADIRPEAVEKTDRKQCRKCKRKKPLAEFHRNASSHDGLARWCKACKTKAAKESRQKRASTSRFAQQLAEMCYDAPLCVLHHRQTDRLKNVRRHASHTGSKVSATKPPEHRSHRFRSQLSSPGLRCPRRQKQREQGNAGGTRS